MKFKKPQILRRIQAGTRTYLLLAGVGAAACVVAPFAAAFIMFKPNADPAREKRQKEFFRSLNSSITLAGDQLQKAFKEFDFEELLDPLNEPWKQKHQKQHDMSDQEWDRKNVRRKT